jgi:hypothetical protein
MPSPHVDRANIRFQRPDFTTASPSTAWSAPRSVSDDECLALLAKAVETHDPESLDQGGLADRALGGSDRIGTRTACPVGLQGKAPHWRDHRLVAFWQTLHQR